MLYRYSTYILYRENVLSINKKTFDSCRALFWVQLSDSMCFQSCLLYFFSVPSGKSCRMVTQIQDKWKVPACDCHTLRQLWEPPLGSRVCAARAGGAWWGVCTSSSSSSHLLIFCSRWSFVFNGRKENPNTSLLFSKYWTMEIK